jgi:rhomboid family GlyGly-CTERM serine protease
MNHLKLLLEHVRQAPATLLLTLTALALFALPELGKQFEFTFTDLQAQGTSGSMGKLWKMGSQLGIWLRVAGSNWLHWSSNHLFWDVAMFYVVGSFCERRGRLLYLSAMAVSALTIPISVAMAAPELGTYRGLSGIDTALFALLSTQLFLAELRRRDWSGSILFGGMLLAMALKIGWELHYQGNLFVADNSFVPVPLAHLVGAIIGAALAMECNLRLIWLRGFPFRKWRSLETTAARKARSSGIRRTRRR